MEKMSQKTRHTSSTLKMDGMAYMRALTTILMPCQREMALRGRRARNVLSDRRTRKFSFSSINKEKTDTYVGIEGRLYGTRDEGWIRRALVSFGW